MYRTVTTSGLETYDSTRAVPAAIVLVELEGDKGSDARARQALRAALGGAR